MFNLRSSCFYDTDMKIENNYRLIDNLYKLIFDFCGVEDLPQISLSCKKFNDIIIKKLDYKYFYNFENNYCSSYNNYE